VSTQDPVDAGISGVRDQIATEVLRVHQDSYGTGAADVEVHLLADLVVVLLSGLELTPGEQTLLDGGYSASVSDMRARFQERIRPTFEAIIERATGRRVRSFLSNTDLDDRYSVEFFRLHPQTG
jgi:uncharacterized protein YbcI